jgi:rod shape determining protein RodA
MELKLLALKDGLILYFINLQPSELMKVAIIVCLARYYHRVQLDKVNSFQNLLTAIVILILPMMLVISQPDLGTSILIALSGLVVIWLTGLNIKYFFIFFFFIINFSTICDCIFRRLSKVKNFNFS